MKSQSSCQPLVLVMILQLACKHAIYTTYVVTASVQIDPAVLDGLDVLGGRSGTGVHLQSAMYSIVFFPSVSLLLFQWYSTVAL